jgi:hypothetical protein
MLLIRLDSAEAATLRVGPGQTYATPCRAFAAAASGDIIEIDASGGYNGDVCAITASNLTIRGLNGRPRIDAAGANSGGKGIWVIQGANTVIENIELSGAKVPDRNGAAIRQEGAGLTLRRVYFHDNENGLLTGANANSEILVEYSEFARNGYGDGYSHNLYIGRIKKLTFRYNWSHDAKVGHHLKTRAAENLIFTNRFDDLGGGTSSYNIDVPDGGRTYVIGNIIQQTSATQNSGLLAYGMESTFNPLRDLYAVNNTFVNQAASGTFIGVRNTTVPAIIKNNVFGGPGSVTSQAEAIQQGNYSSASPAFVDVATLNVRPSPGAPFINIGVNPGVSQAGLSLTPTTQYVHPANQQARPVSGALDAGAYEAAATSSPTPSATPTATAMPQPTATPTATPRPTVIPTATPIASPPPIIAAPQSLFSTQTPSSLNNSDGAGVNYELGLRFTSNTAGRISGIRFYKSPSERGTHTGKIYSASGQVLAQVTFTSETVSGWQEAKLATPVTITANTEYTVAVNTGSTYYVATVAGLSNQVSQGNLRSVVGNNGVFGPVGSKPTRAWNNTNYFRDIVFIANQ